MSGMFRADNIKQGIVYDPRTKLFLMLTVCMFAIGGMGAEHGAWMSVFVGALPILLLCTAGQWRKAIFYCVIYLLLGFFQVYVLPTIEGALQGICILCCMVGLRLMPGIIMGVYLMATTTVSEFVAAMERMHCPQAITIPLAVMFRMFPTVMEEFDSINTAMKMRDIRFGGKNAGKLVEYRMIPLLMCSVNIGNELSQAALTRGLTGKRKRTNICEIGFHIQDICAFVIATIPYLWWILSKLEVL